MTIRTYMLIVTLKVSQLNATTKRQSMAEWIKKKNGLHICCLEDSHFRFTGTYKLKVRGWMEKGIPCKWNPVKAKTAICIPDKINVKIKTITRDNE